MDGIRSNTFYGHSMKGNAFTSKVIMMDGEVRFWKLFSFLWIIMTTDIALGQESFQKASLECKKTSKGAEYKGTLSITKHDYPCQRWALHVPHVHNYINDYLFSDGNISQAANHCRNPGGIKERPWCFTLVKGIRWQYCDVRVCGCRKSKAGWDYTGRISITSSGRRCQKWISQTPHAQSYTELSSFPDPSIEDAADFCRNPDRWETKGPWCYTIDPNVRWEYCNVPYCECKVSTGGHQYGGKISHTHSGHTCQRWDSQMPHAHRYTDKDCSFPVDLVSDAANNCRNPEPNELGGPWCFTTDPDIRWEYCDIPLCESDDNVNPDNHTALYAYIDDSTTNVKGFSRIENIFLGLFAASLFLTVVTIVTAAIVLFIHQKRNSAHACRSCQPNVHLPADEHSNNIENRRRYKQTKLSYNERYESGAFGDTVFIKQNPSLGSIGGAGGLSKMENDDVFIHTYDSITSSYNMNITPSHDVIPKPVDWSHAGTSKSIQTNSCHGNVYENSSVPFHVIISPKNGRKLFSYDRRKSVS